MITKFNICRTLFLVVAGYFLFDLSPALRIVPMLGYAIFVTIFLLVLFSSHRLVNQIMSNRMLWLGVGMTVATLAISWRLGHGSSGFVMLRMFLRSCPFFLFGIVVCYHEGGTRKILLFLLVIYAAFSVASLFTGVSHEIDTGMSAGRYGQSDAALYSFGLGSWQEPAQRWYFALLGIAALQAVFGLLRTSRKVLYCVSVFAIALSVVLSGYAAPIFLIAFSAGMMTIFHLRSPKRIMIGLILILAFPAAIQIATMFGLKQTAAMIEKTETLVQLVVDEDKSLEDEPTGRHVKAQVSWGTFMEYPIFGAGAYQYTSGQNHYVGGHSSLLDWPAQFGLIGSTGPFLIVLSTLLSIRHGFKRSSGDNRYFFAGLFVFVMTYLINSLGNPTFCVPNIDTIAFFGFGVAHGAARTSQPNFGL